MAATHDDGSTTQRDHPAEVESLDMTALRELVRERRGTQSLRKTAEEVGVSFSTLARVEAGAQPDLTSFTQICAWLGIAPSRFFTPVAERELDPLEQAITHLHQDPRLTSEAANSMADMLKQMYGVLAQSSAQTRPLVACHLRAASAMRPGVPHRLSALLAQMHDGLERLAEAGEL
jgi:transcriptional regulator with XRE-family HTH domain